MNDAPRHREPIPALPGWFTLDPARPHLIGARCTSCGTYFFPPQSAFCRNPDCGGESFEEVELSRTGTLWSYTNAAYRPPEPYVAREPFEPFGIAAVELERERMIVLGQIAKGVELDSLEIGQAMELVLEPLDDGKLIWKWRPAGALSPGPSPASGRGEEEFSLPLAGEGGPKGQERGA